jgi:hypothetical protein
MLPILVVGAVIPEKPPEDAKGREEVVCERKKRAGGEDEEGFASSVAHCWARWEELEERHL